MKNGCLEESGRAALRAVVIELAGVTVALLRREDFRLEIYNLLLLCGGWPGAVPLRVAGGGVDGLVRQIAHERRRVIAVNDFGSASCRRGFPAVEHHRAQERQVRGRQGPAVHGNQIGRVASVLVVDAHYLVVRICGNSDSDAD